MDTYEYVPILPPLVLHEYEKAIIKGITRGVERAMEKGGPAEVALYKFSDEALMLMAAANPDMIDTDHTLGDMLVRDLSDLHRIAIAS